MWQCRQIEVLLATILNLSAYSSLLQEMGGTVCDGVCIRPACHRPRNVRLPAGTNELLPRCSIENQHE